MTSLWPQLKKGVQFTPTMFLNFTEINFPAVIQDWLLRLKRIYVKCGAQHLSQQEGVSVVHGKCKTFFFLQ